MKTYSKSGLDRGNAVIQINAFVSFSLYSFSMGKVLKQSYLLGILRISMAFIFLWAFFDKLFGLGFSTLPKDAWTHGVSPTTGFLTFGSHGSLHMLFVSLAGQQSIDWLFMGGLLLIGLALLFGVGIKIATISGSILLFLIYLSLFPSEHNPVIDEHIIYILVLLLLNQCKDGMWFGFGNWWSHTQLVKKYQFLE